MRKPNHQQQSHGFRAVVAAGIAVLRALAAGAIKRFLPFLPFLLVVSTWITAIIVTESKFILALFCLWVAGLLVAAFMGGKRK